ncbi:adenylate/guanylate cyclase domain-containing protein [Mesorhizobium sp. M4B.F.Ca.ET.215.01.1.1]|uniref:adenylate/guanylate cyclase domain-containing protein n=1 Tax=unclassified Mesorhizobium TaxID=325217 RepID=UPI000FCC1F81|nr:MULTISPECIES: adenylate/guanylate cyclase domain-containing protein [unclassified Mesorhizobium]RVD44540.1 adenylate/guanylate cyclase domain-containing protein [Mesorhizobium sp. M4B.F.Ca.ET.019.03.1.1]RWF66089.1 MAG: adenylate/guanylate cyclase domain-containing protein [Mesorhizobium sp.]TGQ09455.1 adenylate/guanylate cyclase domain-containing protein [Mesorhizobium sp. M4B.F.Ca.ET.215.01.1.1]TGQ31166.1 adenylate/guanylate cyclase domain-containing protein [Mesorhizobium sp. M4B.F.Ca.ET.2
MRRSLFQKYFFVLFAAAIFPIAAGGISNTWFSYVDQHAILSALLQSEATSAADKIESFLDGIQLPLGSTIPPEGSNMASVKQLRLLAVRAMHEVPGILSISIVDGTGAERLHISRIGKNRTESGADRSGDPAVVGLRTAKVWYGPVIYRPGSEPSLTMAMASYDNLAVANSVIAEISLKPIWLIVSEIRVGRSGQGFVIDQAGHLIAHPAISKVMEGADEKAALALRELRDASAAAGGTAIASRNAENERVVIAGAPVTAAGWTVIVEQSQAEAFAPLYASLWRTGGLLFLATVLAAVLAYWLARRMSGPILLLEEGALKIGAGQFDHRLTISTGDELERLAARFNQMAQELATSRDRAERLTRLKRFLAPQVAELVEKAGDERMLAGQRAEVVAVFSDLRGFTAFSSHAEPENLMQVLREYYEALGAIITKYEATLTSFSADGLMILVNAPVPCEEPALHAVKMAVDMQDSTQELISDWRQRGYEIGFGMGLAMGWATVGRIGYEARADYTAIGNVVNLASRLCSSAEDRQILIDYSVARHLPGNMPIVDLGTRQFKGLEGHVRVYNVETQGSERPKLDSAENDARQKG